VLFQIVDDDVDALFKRFFIGMKDDFGFFRAMFFTSVEG